jgi:hypothetical protein
MIWFEYKSNHEYLWFFSYILRNTLNNITYYYIKDYI